MTLSLLLILNKKNHMISSSTHIMDLSHGMFCPSYFRAPYITKETTRKSQTALFVKLSNIKSKEAGRDSGNITFYHSDMEVKTKQE